jgi:phosphatidylglycerol:prolipoprotein diacylglycerol transferase
MFGILVASAMLVAFGCFKRELRRLHRTGSIGMATVWVKGKDGVASAAIMAPQKVAFDLAVVVFVAGIVGARASHILEHTDQFLADPWGMTFTRSGLSIFGALIMGTFAGVLRVRQWALPIRPVLDAAAPAMMLGYVVGRLGCQISGDGDWGIAADMSFKPDWLPAWLWAQTYEHNAVGVLIPTPGVYPTPLYEASMSLVCFALLWSERKHPHQSGWLFAMYLLLAGVERLLIERIRINPVLVVGRLHATQAEIISVVFILLGVVGLLASNSRRNGGVLERS